MSIKEENDPIISLSKSTFGKKNDILHFKEETLKDFKMVQKKITEKYDNLDIEMREKLEAYEKRITTYENKIFELSKLINTDKTIREKVDNLMEFKEKADESMLTGKIRLDNFSKDLKSNVERIDKILTDSVIYPGVIGGISKYKTFHELIDYLLSQTSQTLTFREKSILDFKSYKTKLENIISSFNTQINNLLNTTSEFTKTCVKEAEERMKSIYNIYDDRLQDARIENANYAIGLEKATEALKKELENLYVVKNELYEKVDKGLAEAKNDNTRVVKLFTGYKKNFHIMQHKFTQLADFIKDVRFRINLKEDVQRREYAHMSNMINFDKKNQPGFYDGVYSNKLIKKGFANQIKDYIEGRISADQLFKRKGDRDKEHNSKSVGNEEMLKNHLINTSNNNILPKEETKFNFVDLFEENLKGKGFPDNQQKQSNNIIKEEDENNISTTELNPVLSKTVTDKNIFKNLLKKAKKEEAKNGIKKEESTSPKKENEIKQKKEEAKIQIVSIDKENEKESEKKKPKESENKKVDMKNVIYNLFNVKNIMNNIKEGNNDDNQNKLNSDKNTTNKNFKRATTSMPINNTNVNANPLTQKITENNKEFNIAINNDNNDINKKKNKPTSSVDKRKDVPEIKMKDNIYNNTINSGGQNMPPLNNNLNKKANSSNKKSVKYHIKTNKDNNNSNKGNSRAYSGMKKNDTQTFENIFNNLKSYIPKNEVNKNENSLYPFKKK